jgi:hypothetical protein
MPTNTRQRPFFSALSVAGLLVWGALRAASPDAASHGVLWLDLDKPKDSATAAPIIRNDGSTLPAGADVSLSLRDGKLILRSVSGPVALDETAASLELTGESACVGFTVGEPGSPETRQGWLLVSRDAATGSVTVHDWSCQTSPGTPLRPRPTAIGSSPAGHPLTGFTIPTGPTYRPSQARFPPFLVWAQPAEAPSRWVVPRICQVALFQATEHTPPPWALLQA